ncbi:MAG: STAS domain-containing protein [Oscillospiraceae bacterium]|nr:STAS domain-containing protein [Oscillospiraceae bacterium]
MLNLNVTKDGETLCVALEGRLDTVSSPELEECLREDLPGMTLLVLDFEKLDYISSAGLRVLLQAHKRMNGQGRMVLRNVGESILEIFEVTGFTEILTIE